MARAIAILGVLVLVFALAGCGADADVSRTLGARCDSAAECDDRCLPPASFPGGFCSTSCERSSDCPTDASCADTEAGVCLFECAVDLDCTFLGDGWRCLELSLREDPARKAMVCGGVTR